MDCLSGKGFFGHKAYGKGLKPLNIANVSEGRWVFHPRCEQRFEAGKYIDPEINPGFANAFNLQRIASKILKLNYKKEIGLQDFLKIRSNANAPVPRVTGDEDEAEPECRRSTEPSDQQ